MIRMRVRRDHIVNPEDEWEFHEWYFNGRNMKADRLGRANPRMYSADWLVVVCNNAHCGALAIINKEDLLGMLPPAPQSKPVGVAP
jgi:hypothetical protein